MVRDINAAFMSKDSTNRVGGLLFQANQRGIKIPPATIRRLFELGDQKALEPKMAQALEGALKEATAELERADPQTAKVVADSRQTTGDIFMQTAGNFLDMRYPPEKINEEYKKAGNMYLSAGAYGKAADAFTKAGLYEDAAIALALEAKFADALAILGTMEPIN